MLQKPQQCGKCTQSRDGLAHDANCWFAFQVELMQLRPEVSTLIEDPTLPLYLGTYLRGIFDHWNDRLRSIPPRDFKRRDAVIALRLEKALGFLDQQREHQRAARPRLEIVRRETRAA